MRYWLLPLCLVFSLCGAAEPPARETEMDICKRIAPKYNAQVEQRLFDGTRVDLLSDEYAIEVDWGHKWAEAIGQALYYAQITGKKPAVLLLISDMDKEVQYVYRVQVVAAKYGITVFIEKVTR